MLGEEIVKSLRGMSRFNPFGAMIEGATQVADPAIQMWERFQQMLREEQMKQQNFDPMSQIRQDPVQGEMQPRPSMMQGLRQRMLGF